MTTEQVQHIMTLVMIEKSKEFYGSLHGLPKFRDEAQKKLKTLPEITEEDLREVPRCSGGYCTCFKTQGQVNACPKGEYARYKWDPQSYNCKENYHQ